ncbi:MAG: glycosyltransferase family 4 protein [bacterium]|jgi:glycosyltransferase involved in cell wall biosynthesis
MNPDLRILMPSIYFPPRQGGIESHVYFLARELVRRGHTVKVITTRTEASSPASEDMDGIEVRRLPSFGKHFIGWSLGSVFSAPEITFAARDFDLVHCHTFASALGGSVAALLYGRPLVVTVHSSHFLRMARNPAMRPPLNLVLRKARSILSTSKEIDRVVADLVPGSWTVPIVNGIDTETFKPVAGSLEKAEGEYVLVCPRRLVAKNGVEFLIRAMGILKESMKVRLYITGDGPLAGDLGRLARDLGVGDRIVFMGGVENSRMPSVYSSADLVVVPSLVEATSIAALEAMSCERVVAASRVGGLPEIIDDRVGMLFEPGRPEAIAETVEKASRRTDMADLGAEARRRVEANWSIGKMTDTHEEIYRKVLGERANA